MCVLLFVAVADCSLSLFSSSSNGFGLRSSPVCIALDTKDANEVGPNVASFRDTENISLCSCLSVCLCSVLRTGDFPVRFARQLAALLLVCFEVEAALGGSVFEDSQISFVTR